MIIAIIVFGLVLNKQETAVQGEGYGASTQSVATVPNGVVTVSKPGSRPGAVTIDMFEDAAVPGLRRSSSGSSASRSTRRVDDGKLTVNVPHAELPEPAVGLR